MTGNLYLAVVPEPACGRVPKRGTGVALRSAVVAPCARARVSLRGVRARERERERQRVRGDRSFCARHLISLLLSLVCTHHLDPIHSSTARTTTTVRSRWRPPTFVPINHHHRYYCRRPIQTTNPHSFATSIASILFHLGREVVDHVRSIPLPTHVLPGCAPTHRQRGAPPPLKHSTAPDTPVVVFRRVSRAAIGVPWTDGDFDARKGKPAVTLATTTRKGSRDSDTVIVGERETSINSISTRSE